MVSNNDSNQHLQSTLVMSVEIFRPNFHTFNGTILRRENVSSGKEETEKTKHVKELLVIAPTFSDHCP